MAERAEGRLTKSHSAVSALCWCSLKQHNAGMLRRKHFPFNEHLLGARKAYRHKGTFSVILITLQWHI